MSTGMRTRGAAAATEIARGGPAEVRRESLAQAGAAPAYFSPSIIANDSRM